VTHDEVMGTVHVCTSCHGFDGRSISPTFPNLAGQQANYIVAQLTAFRDHKRADPHAQTYMWGMAGHLSDAMIHGIAAYFSAQKPEVAAPGSPALMAAGEQIYRHGIPSKQVPACQACHGVHGQGMSTIPRLAGQHPGYIEKQLEYFASNARQNPIMHQNAKNLTPVEIQAVANYAAAQ
jgi:cytochrome c553